MMVSVDGEGGMMVRCRGRFLYRDVKSVVTREEV